MNGIRVLRLYHSAVVDEYRNRERLLRERHHYDMHLLCPPAWPEGGQLVRPNPDPSTPVHVVDVLGRQHPNLFWYEMRGLRKVLREVRPHILDLHEEPYSVAVAGALRAVRLEAAELKICVYTAQNLLKRYPPPFSLFERRALAHASAAYPCSTEAGEVLRAKGFNGSLHIIPLGVTIRPKRLRPSGRPRIGFVGRLEPYKGGMIAIEAFTKALPDIDASLEIVGDGSEQAAMRRFALKAEIEERVRFWGAMPQDATLGRIAELDVLLVPSLTTHNWKEQFGRVAAQAMAAGTAVIASDSGSLREVVDGAGMLVPEGDADAFAAALRELLHDPGRASRLGERGRERAAQFLSWDRVADQVDEMYRGILSDSAGR